MRTYAEHELRLSADGNFFSSDSGGFGEYDESYLGLITQDSR